MDAHDSHGHSTAAWIGVTVMLIASAIACYGVVFGPGMLLWIGLALFAVGALAWYMLERNDKSGGARHVDALESPSTRA